MPCIFFPNLERFAKIWDKLKSTILVDFLCISGTVKETWWWSWYLCSNLDGSGKSMRKRNYNFSCSRGLYPFWFSLRRLKIRLVVKDNQKIISATCCINCINLWRACSQFVLQDVQAHKEINCMNQNHNQHN